MTFLLPLPALLLNVPILILQQASFNFSIQPHGVFFDKSNEGALYEDGTSRAQKADDNVQPGQNYTYRWTVPEEVGPTKSDAECITWVYYSSVDPVKDTYSGESSRTRHPRKRAVYVHLGIRVW